MTPWTEAATQELERYFARVRPALVAAGADAQEVIDDLRRHLEAEVQAAQLTVVTEQDVRRLLARIGAPEPPAAGPEQPTAPRAASAPPAVETPRPKASVWLLLLGVVLPAVTLLLEAASGMCAGAFFDPTPTVWHGLLVAFVPLANGLVWLALKRNDPRRLRLLAWLNGAAIGIAIFYSLLFVPLLLPGLFAIIFFGWGLLPWAPTLSLVATLVLRRRLADLGPTPGASLPGFWRGIGLAWLVLAIIQAPVITTRLAMTKAAGESPEAQRQGIRWLRAVGSEDTLLRACYGFTRGAQSADVMGWLIGGGGQVPPEKAREIYFRVTGRPFNAVPAPPVRTGRGVFAELNEWTWDADHGGERVGGRLKGLSLHSSRLDTVIEPDAAWSYTEWTLEFKNDATQPREARAQILLPPDGVVSRLTLWVNGEEREAAFAGRSQTREAYQKIAIQRRRDPVLVTTSGPDRVTMQCFPVPRDGGVMKVRLGITAPLALESGAQGIVRLPAFVERNFTVREGFRHAVWAEAPRELKTTSEQLAAASATPDRSALRGQMDDTELASPRSLLHVPRDPARRAAWTKDTRSPGEHFIRQTITEETGAPPGKVVFVVDGSQDMAAHLPTVAKAIRGLPASADCTVLIASDEVVTLDAATLRTAATPSAAADVLLRWKPRGGQDNLPALLSAWNLAAQKPGGTIVWVHTPQPILLESADALVQACERAANGPKLFELQTEPGPDRVIEKLDGLRAVRPVLRTGTLEEDLTRLIRSWQAPAGEWRITRQQVETQAAAEAGDARESSLHLARLWASEETRRLKGRREVESAVKLAGLYQIVTPVSGAVVLETQQQYDETGLKPVEPQTVPAIPEPGAAKLLLLASVVWWALFRRRRVAESVKSSS